MGMVDEGYLQRARGLVAPDPALHESFAPLLDIADALPSRLGAGGRPLGDDAEIGRMQQAFARRDEWTALLRSRADEDALTAYLWVSFNCAYSQKYPHVASEYLADAPGWRDAPLLAFRAATCAGADAQALAPLLAADPRFGEIEYLLALGRIMQGRLDDADARLQRAVAWHPAWPAGMFSEASVALTAEDFARALDLYDRTLALAPGHADAMIGRVRALVYLGRFADAIAATDILLQGRWYIGDARYWRALAEVQLDQNDRAWDDVEAAGKLLVNADVPKLAGIVAVRRREVEVARQKFELAHERNPNDCETDYDLASVLADQRTWPRAIDLFAATVVCADAAEHGLLAEIAGLRMAAISAERRARQIASKETQIAAGRRMRASAWYNGAVACFNAGRRIEARDLAGKVADDEEFGARAKSLLRASRPGLRPIPCILGGCLCQRKRLLHPPPRAAGPTSPTPCAGTSRSSPTSTTARPRSWTRCCFRAERSAPTSAWPSGPWTAWNSSASAASPSWPRTRRFTIMTRSSTSSTRRGTPTSAARWSGRCRWWTA